MSDDPVETSPSREDAGGTKQGVAGWLETGFQGSSPLKLVLGCNDEMKAPVKLF